MLFNFFKKEKQKESRSKADQPLIEKQELQKKKGKEISISKKKVKNSPSLPTVLRNPHITEKATLLGEEGQYVFRVDPEATKGAVKQSVEALYGVSVRSVHMIKKPAKKIRIGRKEGFQQGLKKAVVKLKRGENIEVISR